MSENQPQHVLDHPTNLQQSPAGESARVSAFQASPANPPSLNQVLINLRIAVMRTISDVWKSDRSTLESSKVTNWQEAAEKIIDTLSNEPFEKPLSVDAFNQWLAGYLKNAPEKNAFGVLVDSENAALFRKLIELSNPENLKSIWRLSYGLQSPYPTFGVQIIQPTARWNFYGDSQWTKPDTEELFISMPVDLPENLMPGANQAQSGNQLVLNGNPIPNVTASNYDDVREYVKASIAMEYYQHFPSFLGRLSGDETPRPVTATFMTLKKVSDFPQMDKTLPLGSLRSDLAITDPSGNNYDLGIAANQFQGFSAMATKLLASLWANDTVRKRLDYGLRLFNETTLLDSYAREQAGLDETITPETCSFNSLYQFSFYLKNLKGKAQEELEQFNRLYSEEVDAILKKHFNYVSPWVFKFRLVVPNSEVFFEKQYRNGREIGATFNPDQGHVLNLTTIEIPHSPGVQDTNNVSLALARYNATGPAYPFTCS